MGLVDGFGMMGFGACENPKLIECSRLNHLPEFSTPALFESSLHSLPLVGRGKVRDIYAVGSDRLLIITTDRLSAFDVVLSEPIPGKGQVLNAMAQFWFDRLASIVPNHLTGVSPEMVVAPDEQAQVQGRAMVVKRLQPIPVEAVVRGYLIGSGWKDYQADGSVCGIKLPAGLHQAERLPEPIFTPATKADLGAHDENISFAEMVHRIGEPLAEQIRSVSLALYRDACEYARTRGILIADTKFEFGLDEAGTLHLMDEVLTADSSRFWPADTWVVGQSPPSFDKQFVRDWLESQPWDKQAPAPHLPPEVVARTAEKYREALFRLSNDSAIRVGVVMGSASDWETMRHAVEILEKFGIAYEARVISAHRMPDTLFDYAQSAQGRGLRAIVAGAGGAAHLPGMLAAKTIVPILGVPVPSRHLQGQDSLLSIVQMPRGIPVGTFAIGEAGAANAALHAVAMLATTDPALADSLNRFRQQQTAAASAMVLPPATSPGPATSPATSKR
jgi:phosphoribosylaminoimidazole-succinocarboxamide synthase